jgi:MoaA/NifB/PqqE/SkfB family radical SAM enzyme
MNIPRVCFYHLVYAGRGTEMVKDDLTHEETRAAVDLIIDRTRALHAKGIAKEVLTVDNHADGPYLYMRLLKEDPERAKEVLELLQDERGQQLGPRHRLRQLGRRGICRPVLAPPQLRQRPPAPLFRNLDPAGRRPAA